VIQYKRREHQVIDPQSLLIKSPIMAVFKNYKENRYKGILKDRMEELIYYCYQILLKKSENLI
jgi:hypothetical protein